jgi:hypothetical protein
MVRPAHALITFAPPPPHHFPRLHSLIYNFLKFLNHSATARDHTTARMRLVKSQIEAKTGAGSATLLPEEPEDMVSELEICMWRLF